MSGLIISLPMDIITMLYMNIALRVICYSICGLNNDNFCSLLDRYKKCITLTLKIIVDGISRKQNIKNSNAFNSRVSVYNVMYDDLSFYFQ